MGPAQGLDRRQPRDAAPPRARPRLPAAWEEQGRDPSLLLPPGLPLEEGRKLLDDHGDVLIDEVQPYIEASLAADEARQREAAANG